MIVHRLISLVRRGTCLLPPRFALRTLTFIDSLIGSAEPENVHVPLLVARQRHAVAVDVGANNGVTTCIMARHFDQVLAFEANPRLAAWLKKAAPDHVQVHGVALSSQAGDAVLNIPVSSGVTLEGWGSLESPLIAKFERLEQTRVKTFTLDSLHLPAVDLIKIDVEGHEIAVLTGACETISRCLPWLVIEAVEEKQAQVRAFVQPLGYRETTLPELTGHKSSAHNLVFMPPDPS